MSTTAPRGDDNFLNVKEGDDYTVLRLVGAGENAVVLSTADAHEVAKDVADGVLLARKEDGSLSWKARRRIWTAMPQGLSAPCFPFKPPAWRD